MFSEFPVRAQQWRDFASAHSCGLRRDTATQPEADPAFATAHSCGLRPLQQTKKGEVKSLPQRIRAGCDLTATATVKTVGTFASAHSCGLRLRKSNAAHCEFAARR